MQGLQHGVGIAVVEGMELSANPLGPVFQPALAVRQRPQADEEQAGEGRQFGQFVVEKEFRLDRANSAHPRRSRSISVNRRRGQFAGR